eukprot:6182073-Pleurochrysis_carterae.AAC.2
MEREGPTHIDLPSRGRRIAVWRRLSLGSTRSRKIKYVFVVTRTEMRGTRTKPLEGVEQAGDEDQAATK